MHGCAHVRNCTAQTTTPPRSCKIHLEVVVALWLTRAENCRATPPPPPAGLPGLSLPPHPVLALCHVVVASTGAQYCVCGGRPAHVRRTRTAFHQVKHLASLAKAVMRWENQPVSFAAVQGSPPFFERCRPAPLSPGTERKNGCRVLFLNLEPARVLALLEWPLMMKKVKCCGHNGEDSIAS